MKHWNRVRGFCSCVLAWMLYIAMTAIVISGCSQSGPKSCPVAGKVTFQGKPISKGMVRFCNLQLGIDVVAKIDPEGNYKIVTANGSGLPKGAYQVAVMPGGESDPVGTFVEPREIYTMLNPSNIPIKYRQPTSSGLTLTVKSGNNDFNIDMQP